MLKYNVPAQQSADTEQVGEIDNKTSEQVNEMNQQDYTLGYSYDITIHKNYSFIQFYMLQI